MGLILVLLVRLLPFGEETDRYCIILCWVSRLVWSGLVLGVLGGLGGFEGTVIVFSLLL